MEVEEDEAFGLGEGLAGDLVFWIGSAGAVPKALVTSDPRTLGA